MKKRTIITLAVAGSLLIAGIMISIIGLAFIAFNPAKLEAIRGQQEQKVYTTAVGDLVELQVTSSNHGISVIPTTDSQIRITYTETDRYHYTISNAGGKLTMAFFEDRRFFWFGDFMQFNENAVVVELPAAYTGSLDVKTSNTEISLTDLNLKAPIRAQTSNQKISVRNVSTTGEIDAKTSNSQIVLENAIASSIRAETSNAKIMLAEIKAATVTAKTSNSAIEVTALKAEQISFKTSNGKIRGTIDGSSKDYRIESDTSNGDDSLANLGGSGPNTLTATTSNADIEIQFSEGADF